LVENFGYTRYNFYDYFLVSTRTQSYSI